jgi:uncharacterized surface protein with fasciclin (FAS1) repeats
MKGKTPMRRSIQSIMVIGILTAFLAACGGAPAPQSSGSSTAPPAASGGAATTAPAPALATASLAPTTATTSTAPNDATQARLRVGLFVPGSPSADMVVNGTVAVNAGQAQVNMPAGYVNGYVFLAPGTYKVAIVPTGKGVEQALIGPLDVPMVAGHRYTLAMLGQLTDKHFTPLVIDETAAEMKIGAVPTDSVRILVNNLAGAAGIDTLQDGKVINANTLFGGFAASIYLTENTPIEMTVTGDPKSALREFDKPYWHTPGASSLYAFAGHYPGSDGVEWWSFGAPATSELNSIEFLQGFSGKNLIINGTTASFDTFLAALKTAGLTEILATGGPYLVLAPTDAAFAAIPKAKRDALMANPKALGDLLRNHIVAEYIPRGSMSKTPGGSHYDRTLTNLLGAKLAIGDGFTINGADVWAFGGTFVANGTQVLSIATVLLPAAK